MLALLACAADGSRRNGLLVPVAGPRAGPHSEKDVESQWVAPTDELAASTTEAEYSEPANEIEDSDLVVEPEKSAVVDGALRAPARFGNDCWSNSAVIGGKGSLARRLEGLANEFRLRIEDVRLKRRLGDLLEGIFETSMLCE